MNEHSRKYEDLKMYYETGRWNKSLLKAAAKKQWITQEEYEEITGEAYA